MNKRSDFDLFERSKKDEKGVELWINI